MLDCKDEDSNSNQDSTMLDDLHSKISEDTQKMMDQQFARPTHTSVGKDFMSLEDTLNDILRRIGDRVVFDLAAQEAKAPQPGHKDDALHDPILRAQTIEAQHKACVTMELLRQPMPHQSSVDLCSKGAQEGTEFMATREVNETEYWQPDALIPDH
jgi:hypothetical protein